MFRAKEALAEAERRRKEKEANDKQFRDDAARRVKDAQDRLAEITLPPILQKQRDARQRFQEDKYYGVPGAEALLQGTLWSNAGEEAGKQLKDFDLSEILSSGGQDVSKGLAKIQQAQQKAWAARLKMFMTSDVRGTVDSIGATINGIKAGQKSDKKDNQFEIRQVRATLENQVAPSFGNMFASLAQTMDSLVKNSPRVRAKAMGAEAARDAGRIGSQAFMDLAQGRNVIGNALERVKGEVFGAIGEEIGRGVERSLRKRLSKVFEDAISEGVGKKLEGALEGSLKGIEASAGAILSASYNLVAALSRKKKFGIGTALGIAAGLLIPGAQPFLPALANAGNAIDNSDWKGLVLAGASTYAGSRLDVGGSPANTSSTTLGAGTTATSRGRSMVIVNHYGNINGMEDLEGASQRQGRAIERALAFS
nr:hypothetical protein [Armatimonas sp.]